MMMTPTDLERLSNGGKPNSAPASGQATSNQGFFNKPNSAPGIGRGKTEELQDLSEHHPKAVAKVFILLIFVAAGIVATFTIGPYITFVKKLGEIPALGVALVALASLPLIGSLFAWIGGAAATIAGVSLWALVQIMELWELTMTLSPTHMSRVFNASEQAKNGRKQVPEASKQARLQAKHNFHPLAALTLAMTLRLAGLIIELVIGWCVVPPCEGGIWKFFIYLVGFQWGKINWGNVAVMAMLLFALECCYRLYVHVRDYRYHSKILDEKQGA